ncbi:MAG TPA: DUF4173 domain-containing protein [Leptolinea sp.]
MPIKYASRILWGSLILGLCFDLLFWKKAPGINFFIFVILVTAAGIIFAYLEGQKPAGLSWLLIGFVVFFSAMTFIRQEPFTTFINVLLTLVCMGLLVLTLTSGIWLRYSLADAVTGAVRLVSSALGGGSTLLVSSKKIAKTDSSDKPVNEHKRISIWAVLRGLLMAFPVVFLLALLLVSADPIFSQALKRFLNIDQFMEYAVQMVMIAITGYLLSGVYLYSLEKSKRKDLIGIDKPWFMPFLGFTESAIILGSVNLLFAFFVAVQFKYFFGGQANIAVDGYTFAEYARKGFGELVTVAFLSLLLYLGLSAITRRDSNLKQKWFAGLGVALVGLVVVILVSSFYRLSLLEDAYGFTRVRTYSHVFMIWLGILLAVVIGLEIANYRRGFAMAAFLVVIGFGITLNILNVDSFILVANVKRAETSGNLDYSYLQELSNDSVPQALVQFRTTKVQEVKYLLGAALACRADNLERNLKTWQWQGYHVSFVTAINELRAAKPELSGYIVNNSADGWYANTVNTPVGEKDCYSISHRGD